MLFSGMLLPSWVKPASYVLAALALVFSGMRAQSFIDSVELNRIKTEQLKSRAESAESSLKNLQDASTRIKEAADQFHTINDSLVVRMDAIRKDMKNAKPLPPDCRPDADRVRKLSDAISAANQAIAGQRIVPPVQTNQDPGK